MDELDDPKNKGRIAGWEKKGIEVIKSDLQYNNGLRYVGRHTDLAWKWINKKELENTDSLLILEPNFYGIGVRLKPFFNWLRQKMLR